MNEKICPYCKRNPLGYFMSALSNRIPVSCGQKKCAQKHAYARNKKYKERKKQATVLD